MPGRVSRSVRGLKNRMWVRKNSEEIERDRKWKYMNPKLPFLFSFLIFLLTSISNKVGYKQWKTPWPSFDPMSWDEFFSGGLVVALLIGFLFFLLFYAWQLITKRPMMRGAPTLICLNCNQVKKRDSVLNCNCGGKFVLLDEMRWVNSEKEKSDL